MAFYKSPHGLKENENISKKIESSVKQLDKEAPYLRQEVWEEAQDIKDELGGKVESTAHEVQHIGQELRGKAQDIKDELGGKVEFESTAQEAPHLGQELRDKAQDITNESWTTCGTIFNRVILPLFKTIFRNFCNFILFSSLH